MHVFDVFGRVLDVEYFLNVTQIVSSIYFHGCASYSIQYIIPYWASVWYDFGIQHTGVDPTKSRSYHTSYQYGMISNHTQVNTVWHHFCHTAYRYGTKSYHTAVWYDLQHTIPVWHQIIPYSSMV